MKVYKVMFNDGGWHRTDLPSRMVVAESESSAVEKAKKKHPHYSDHEAWATELEIDGYVIVAYDKKEYEREQKIKEVLDGE